MTSGRPRGALRRLLTAAAVAALAVGAAACNEEIPEALTEQAVGVDAEIGDRDAPPPEGAEADDEVEHAAGAYPDELPQELPLPGGMDLVDSSVEEVEDGTRITMETVDVGDFDDAVLFYEDELPTNGWTVLENVEGEQDGVRTERWKIEGFGWTGSIELREEGEAGDLGGTTTRLLVELRSSG